MKAIGTSRSGFSLVEVSLAMLVVALGVMTVFALFPQALDSGRRATEAGEVACFASYVFSAMEAVDVSTNAWRFSTFGNVNIQKTHALAEVFGNQPILEEHDASDPGFFFWTPSWYGNEADDYWAIAKYAVASFTYTLEYGDGPAGQTKYVRLEVWPGDKRAQVSSGQFRRGTVFYREYFLPW